MKYLMVVFVSCMTMGSQLLLKKAIVMIGPLMQGDKFAFLFAAITSPFVILAIVMQGVGFFLWMFVLNSMKLGVAFGLSGAIFYILIALSSMYFYGERLSLQQWGGLLLISAGGFLITLAKS
jgi:multidrug transporter EmrE-like cation transporter